MQVVQRGKKVRNGPAKKIGKRMMGDGHAHIERYQSSNYQQLETTIPSFLGLQAVYKLTGGMALASVAVMIG